MYSYQRLTEKLTHPAFWAALMTLALALLLITPLCGLLFQCGCDWPWAGLDEKCNFHQMHVKQRCPWCVSLSTGIISTGLATLFGVSAAILFNEPQLNLTKPWEIGIRILFGIVVFILIAAIAALISGIGQGYYE